jgi:hypothetical protein
MYLYVQRGKGKVKENKEILAKQAKGRLHRMLPKEPSSTENLTNGQRRGGGSCQSALVIIAILKRQSHEIFKNFFVIGQVALKKFSENC